VKRRETAKERKAFVVDAFHLPDIVLSFVFSAAPPALCCTHTHTHTHTQIHTPTHTHKYTHTHTHIRSSLPVTSTLFFVV